MGQIKESKAVSELQILTLNFLPKKARAGKLEGRDYTVVPMVMLTEGVHKGSKGAMYYPPEEIGKTPASWDHKPIVVNHPEENGEGISACRPDVLEARKIGLILNTSSDGKGRLKAEAWIETAKADLIDGRVMGAIKSGKMMELSTGLFHDLEETAGEWKSEKYIGIARNYRPDHLALLPDSQGACSIKDGAGFIRNAAAGAEVTENEMSFDGIRSALCNALNKKNNVDQNKGPYLWVESVYSDFVIYSFNGKLFRISYTSDDDNVALSDEKAVEVYRVTEYRTVKGAYVGNQDRKPQDDEVMKKKIVDALVSNSSSGWTEEDREMLTAMDEKALTKLSAQADKAATAAKAEKDAAELVATNKAKADKEAAEAAAKIKGETPPPAKVPTLNEFLAQAPREVASMVRNSLALAAEQQAHLIGVITANARNRFTKAQLEAKELPELQALADLAAPEGEAPAHNRLAYYGGQGNVTDNSGFSDEEPLGLPTMNFAAKK